MSSIYLQAKTVPADAEIPGNLQELINLIAQYEGVIGFEGITSINFGSTTPAAEDRDKPWFKTTPSGSPIGLFSWSGTDWKQTPLAPLSGTTVQRPATPATYTMYFDTDIGCMLIFERSKWRTLSGCSGDVKYVRAATLEEAIRRNPGWKECFDARGRVIGAAGEAQGLTARAYGDKVGEEKHKLLVEELPAHTHDITMQNDRMSRHDLAIAAFPGDASPSIGESSTKRNTDSLGGDKAHENMQPTIFFWCIEKE